MSSAFVAQLPLIGSITTLGWTRDDVAQSYMSFIKQRIEILLSRRGWRVGVLKEFYPRGARLLGLNVNHGSEVCIRFRVPGRKEEFLPFHEVVCTTLHEVAHCQISQHNSAFWSLYYELVRECEALEVQLIAQGVPLYPPHISDAATLRSTAPTASSSASTQRPQRPKGKSSASPRASRKPATSAGRGHVLGGGAVATRATRQGSRTVTQRLPKLPSFLENDSPPPATNTGNGAPPEGGHRLGGSAEGRTTALTPAERRRLVAEAALRRFIAERPPVSAANSGSALDATTPAPGRTMTSSDGDEDHCDPLREDDRDLPRPSLSQVAVHVAGTLPDVEPDTAGTEDEIASETRALSDAWRCPRCNFVNSTKWETCAVCADAEDDSIAAREGCDQPPAKRQRADTPPSGTADAPISISDSSDESDG